MLNQGECTKCGKLKHKEFIKTVLRGNAGWKRDIFVDDKGRQWTYNRCPDCKVKTYYKEETIAATKPKRKCRRCGDELKVNYFYHDECLQIVESAAGHMFDNYGCGVAYNESKARG